MIYEWCPKSSCKLKPIDESAEWWSIKLDEEWEEAPVGFMTAVKSDFFTVKHDFMPSGEDVFTLSSLVAYFWNKLNDDEMKDVILNGKFYL